MEKVNSETLRFEAMQFIGRWLVAVGEERCNVCTIAEMEGPGWDALQKGGEAAVLALDAIEANYIDAIKN